MHQSPHRVVNAQRVAGLALLVAALGLVLQANAAVQGLAIEHDTSVAALCAMHMPNVLYTYEHDIYGHDHAHIELAVSWINCTECPHLPAPAPKP